LFLNQSRRLGRPVDWNPEAPALWTFNLHYFEYLDELPRAEQKALCREWVEANSVGREPAWHPYPTSRRIINWCKADFEDADLRRSLYRQAAFLSKSTETHLFGNHLLENARALLFAGCYFDGDEPALWKEQGLTLLRDQADEQILDDGGHFERSPMYHALMLEGYVDASNLLPPGHPDQEFLTEIVRRMSDFLVSMTHPDGRIALFNDAAHRIAPSTEEIVDYVRRVTGYRPKRQQAFAQTGYFRMDHGPLCFIIDGGAIGPDYLPAHAHADIFSYELYLGDVPFIVDAGTYGYDSGLMRSYVRSTKAHNTVCVDGVDQAECWSSFRVARRYAPEDVTLQQHGNTVVFDGCFTGYAHLIGDGIVHRRCVRARRRQGQVQVTDYVGGDGVHTVTSRLHLHPEVSVRPHERGCCLANRGRSLELSTVDSQVRLEEEWYCPEFGIRKKASVLVMQRRRRLPLQLRHTIQY